jgi:K+-transporting ATPase KdpF subunit
LRACEANMLDLMLGAIVAAGVGAYLVYALLYPEKL